MTPIKWTDNVEPIRRLTPLDRCYIEVEDDLPFAFDFQHSCSHGTERCQKAEQAGCVAVVCVVVCSLIVVGATLAAAWRARG